MINKAYDKLKSHALVDWGVVLLGVQAAFGVDFGRLNRDKIGDFAESELEVLQSSDAGFDAVAALALDSDMPTEDLERLIEGICQTRGVDIDCSRRKWRVALTDVLFNEIDLDPFYGSIQLSEIWSRWGWPDDGPKTMLKNSENIPVEEFGSPEAFLCAKRETQEWIDSEYASKKLSQ